MRPLLYIVTAGLIGTCSAPPSLLDQVREVGELRVVTRDAPSAAVIGPDGPSGPEFDLVQGFADELGVALVIESVSSVSEIVPQLLQGRVHMAAAGLSITDSRKEYVNFGHPYESVDMQLIYRLGEGKPNSIDDIVGKRIEVLAGSSHADMLASLKTEYPGLEWTENADAEVSVLLGKVASGEIDYTVADSTEFNIHRNFHPDLRVAMDLQMGDPLAWAFSKDSGNSLLAKADEYLIEQSRNGTLDRIHDRYYGHTKKFDYVGTRNFIRHYESRLPRYRDSFEKAGDEWGVDWRLLAAIAYQESHWRSQAISPTGVKGIMMLTEDTANYLGLDDRVDPITSIFGGARFYARQTERIPDTVDEPDRTWMALAAYNVGFNHIKDARWIVEQKGGDPDSWMDLEQALPLLAQRQWFAQLPYGYARGWEPVMYVNNIRSYYEILVWLTDNETPEPGEAAIASSS
jgi:membrane-bound lytic murein transglycosylase F